MITQSGTQQSAAAHRGPAMPERKPSSPNVPSAVQRYGLAVVSVALAVLLGLLLQHYEFRHTLLSLFLFAIALTAWYAGAGPAALSIVLSIVCFTYFFASPIYSFAFTLADVPAMVILVCFAVLITGFSTVRRRIEDQLLQARDELQADIEDRKKAEEKLRRSEAYLAEAQRLNKTGSWGFRPGVAKPVYWSEEMFRIWGFDPQHGVPDNETAWQRIHPEDLKTVVKEQIDKTSAGSFRVDVVNEFRIVLPDGTVKYLQGTSHPVFDDTGKVVEYVGTSVDVTERKQAEQARQELEERWKAAFESNPTMYFIVDPAGGILSVNAFGAEQLGYTVAELVGRPVLNVFHEPDREAVKKHARECFQHPGRMMRWEARKICKDGTMLWVRETANAVVLQKQPVLLVVCENITEQKRAEEERKRAEEALRRSETYLAEGQRLTKTGSWAWDARNDRMLYCSDEIYRIFGLEPQIGVPSIEAFLQRIHPDDRDRVRTDSVRSGSRDQAEQTLEYRLLLPDGNLKYVLSTRHAVFDEAGELVERVGTIVDVTERKLAEGERERLRQLEADLAHMNRVSMMGELAASLAHEIKQPIAAAATDAKTGLRWLQREPPDIQEAREAASRTVKDVIRAAEIIDRNRAMYRRDTPLREVVDLNKVIREMIVLLHDSATRQSVSISAELGEGLPSITADRVQLQQVLMNLMLNGIEAMRNTQGQLTIRSTKTEDGQIQISVSDMGVGLPAEKTDHIFDAFFTTKPQGTGMGLSISRRIIESHGGRLWACANEGRGATFNFTLPTAP